MSQGKDKSNQKLDAQGVLPDNMKFMDLSGKEIENPQSAIHKRNIGSEGKKINYQAFQESTKVGIVELWGRRATQEDRVAAGQLFGFADLTEVERFTVLENTVMILQDIITQVNLGHQGSTFCSTVIVGNDVYTTNLGDGTAFLCIVNHSGNVTLELLNTRHNPDEPGEFERLKRNNILVIHKRLAGTLAVSRALGDQEYERYGLSHTPEINCHHVKTKEGEQAFIINACDGLTESDPACYPERIELLKEIIKATYHKAPNEIALSLARAALDASVSDQYPELKVGDNISVMIAKIDPQNKRATYMLICDGHGGDEVSDAASQLYDAVIKNQILLAKLKDLDLKFVELTSGLLKSNRNGKDIAAIKALYQDFNVMLINKLAKNR